MVLIREIYWRGHVVKLGAFGVNWCQLVSIGYLWVINGLQVAIYCYWEALHGYGWYCESEMFDIRQCEQGRRSHDNCKSSTMSLSIPILRHLKAGVRGKSDLI